MNSKPFSIGSTPLNPVRVDKEFIKSTREAIEGGKSRKGRAAATRILDEWTPSKPLDAAQLEQLNTYVDTVQTDYKDMENEWWSLRQQSASTQALEEKMAPEGLVLLKQEKLKTELREANARAAVQAMAGTLSGVPGLVAAYSAYANGPSWSGPETANTEAVLKGIKSLQDGTSPMITKGNEVQQVHNEQLWKTMNNLLDQSIVSAQAGNPTEVNVQIYELTSHEMVDKLADTARAGNKVRLNLDPGRLSFPSRDSDGETYFSLDATPDKLRTIIQLATLPEADIAVSLFPQKKLLNSPTDLMHRKVFRVGEQVLVSGMNANLGSGENVDSGYLVRGEAAARLTDNLARDVQLSKAATLEDIWGQIHIDKFDETNLRLGPRGFVALLDCLGDGPSQPGTRLPEIESQDQLEKMAEKAGLQFSELVAVPKADYEKEVARMLAGRAQLQLSKKGKKALQELIQKAIDVTSDPENLGRLDDISIPSSKTGGTTRVDVADQPVERESLVVAAIAEAEQFCYIPGFVITRAVAAALAERRDQLLETGIQFDVRVVADAGLYPHGGTPNSYGVKFLEDRGIQPRWSLLERSGDHDRKIHAKQLLTDKGEITGSTNFSNQGMRENWETSVYVHFDTADAEKSRTESQAQFLDLWETSYELNTVDHSSFANRDKAGSNKDWFVEQGRDQSIVYTLRMIGNYERETGKLHQQLLHENPEIAARKQALEAEGYSYGDATLRAVREILGPETHRQMLDGLPSYQSLQKLKTDVEAYKKDGTVPAQGVASESPTEGGSELPPEMFFS